MPGPPVYLASLDFNRQGRVGCYAKATAAEKSDGEEPGRIGDYSLIQPLGSKLPRFHFRITRTVAIWHLNWPDGFRAGPNDSWHSATGIRQVDPESNREMRRPA
jgi:hypothetical protein